MRINFDLDGTIANLYGVDNWLEYLLAEDTTPYDVAKPLLNLSLLARLLNRLHKRGFEIAVISWGSKNSTDEYLERVKEAKQEWLNRHLKSVQFDEITVVPYGTPKENYKNSIHDILFDDEAPNRETWQNNAYDESEIIDVLKALLD